MRIVGTRSRVGTPTISLIDQLGAGGHVAHVDVASAYWDARGFDYVREIAARIDGPVRLVLWTAGGSRPAWRAAEALDPDSGVELRFVDSPAESGIFHAKVAGAARGDGTWSGAFVGSGNLTDAAMRRNVELGVWITDDPPALAELRDWFEELFAAATPAAAVDFEHALRIVPETSEAATRNQIFRAAALAAPAPSGPVERARPWHAG